MQSEREIDIHVGRQVKKRRQELGLSQSALARQLGLTFQQVQKMEKGVNRIGAGRLKQLTTLLDMPIERFYDGLRERSAPQGRRLPPALEQRIEALISEIHKVLR